MARKENMADLEEDFGVFTLNDTSVGRNGKNFKRSDVQLIQFFLMQFYFEHPELFAFVPPTRSGAPIIKIDGICGRQTEMAILYYQRYVLEGGSAIAADGLVSVAHSVMSSITNTTYTIMDLNNWFRLFGNGKEFHGNLENHPNIVSFAPELRAELASAAVGDVLSNT